MAAQKRSAPQRSQPRRKAKASAADPTSAIAVASRNLMNMAAVTAACATILLCLLIVKKF